MSQPVDDRLAIDTIRFLAVDMVEQAQSGHPGAPLGQAPLAHLLFTRQLRFDPADPAWPNRDRFVLSCGHASALIYALLHLSGYDLDLDELRNFRQLGSKTPGHPEFGHTDGVETTTGPLGQGLATAVGMAIAERYLASHFNRDGFDIFDHNTWVIASDGDLMEGVAAEASSMAGHLGLSKLKVFWDDNRISIEGSTDLAFTEDVLERYRSYGWATLEIDDVEDLDAVDAVLAQAAAETERPVLVRARTHIGFGSPKQDTAASHGSPLGADGVKATKEKLDWPLEPTFHVPDGARAAYAPSIENGKAAHVAWLDLVERYRDAHPELAATLDAWRTRGLPEGWDAELPTYAADHAKIATRKASGAALTALAGRLPQLLGGSADLAGSNNTFIKGRDAQAADTHGGGNFHFGVREHAMGAAMNGMALSGMLRPYGGTFLIFSDYMRPAMRLSALMGQPAIYVLTHDSIFLGEDGPTHQPISQLMGLRAMPGMTVLRPADGNETVAAWRVAIEKTDGPVSLVLTRQGLPILPLAPDEVTAGVRRGAYVVADADDPQLLLLATGSEVPLILDAHRALAREGIRSRVVSMPSWELFDAQDPEYRAQVLPDSVRHRLAVEAGCTFGWQKYTGLDGDVLGIDGFGASAPAADLAKHYGFTAENVVARAKALIGDKA
ncbi:MAG: transketolase [Acidobacteriota bacterium]